MTPITINACSFALFCVLGLGNLMHAVAQTQTTPQDPPKVVEKRSDKIDLLYKGSMVYLAAGTAIDMVTTVQGMDHPTVASRADGSFLTHYYGTETGWASFLGNRSPGAAVGANVALNVGIAFLSRNLYRRGGRWRIAAVALNMAKATGNVESGIHNMQTTAGIDRRIQLATGYQGAIHWSF